MLDFKVGISGTLKPPCDQEIRLYRTSGKPSDLAPRARIQTHKNRPDGSQPERVPVGFRKLSLVKLNSALTTAWGGSGR